MPLDPKPTSDGQWKVDARSIGLGRRFFKSDAEAKEWVRVKVKECSKAGLDIARLETKDRMAALMAVAEAKAMGVSLAEIIAFFKRENKPVTAISISEAKEKFIETKKAAGKRERYTRQLGYSLSSLVEYVGEKTKCHDVAKGKVESWLTGNGWSNRTKKGYLIDAATFFNFCLKNQWVGKSPCEGIERISVEDAKICILTVDECKKLMTTTKASYPDLLPYVTLTLFCGIRPAEVFRLTWSDVDLEHGHVIVAGEKSKTRQRRVVTIQPNALDWLRLAKDKPIMAENWQRRFTKLRALAGVTWGHDICRHSYVSYSFAVFGAAKTAAEAGHSETILTKHYREIIKPADAKAFWEIRP